MEREYQRIGNLVRTTVPFYKDKGDAVECGKQRTEATRTWNDSVQKCVGEET